MHMRESAICKITVVAAVALLALVALGLACGGAWASESYTPPQGGEGEQWQMIRLYLKPPAGSSSKARGSAAFMCNLAETLHQVSVYAKGLRPGGVYSLWVYRMSDKGQVSARAGLGRANIIKADKRGVLAYAASLPWCVAGKYNWLVVRYHPGGKAKNEKRAVTVLKGPIVVD